MLDLTPVALVQNIDLGRRKPICLRLFRLAKLDNLG